MGRPTIWSNRIVNPIMIQHNTQQQISQRLVGVNLKSLPHPEPSRERRKTSEALTAPIIKLTSWTACRRRPSAAKRGSCLERDNKKGGKKQSHRQHYDDTAQHSTRDLPACCWGQ